MQLINRDAFVCLSVLFSLGIVIWGANKSNNCARAHLL